MQWRCSNENAAKKRHAHSAPTAFMAGSSFAFHIAANVWDSPVVGTLAIFDRARREVLDGTESLSSSLYCSSRLSSFIAAYHPPFGHRFAALPNFSPRPCLLLSCCSSFFRALIPGSDFRLRRSV